MRIMTKYVLEYIWLGGNYEIRTKTKVLETTEHICLHNIQIFSLEL